MIVDEVRLEERGDEARLVAQVAWEDRVREPRELWYAVPHAHAAALRPRGDALLVSCAVLAQHHGESRLQVRATVCPRLAEGTGTALAWLRRWYHRDRPELTIEAPLDSHVDPAPTARSGLFLSGGVDSLHALWRNHRRVPVGHPHRFSLGIVVDGIEEYRSSAFERATQSIAEATELELVRPRTNLRSLDPDGAFWRSQWFGAALASVAHVLDGSLTAVTIASSHWVGEEPLEPLGSHPVLDPALSSQRLQVLHTGVERDRVSRLRELVDWPVARRHLRVCSREAGDDLNCGRCRKCRMAMLALVALGRLADFESFPQHDLQAGWIADQRLFCRADIDPYLPLVPELRAVGREDLADALRHLDEDFRTWDQWRRRALDDIAAALPEAAPFLLADEGSLGTDETVRGRPRIQLWGPAAADPDRALVTELERHAADGVRHLVVAWPAAWWLEVYRGLASWLDSRQQLLLRTERVTVYELGGPVP